jgi:16S rRNA G966 N2-methylase RsmD
LRAEEMQFLVIFWAPPYGRIEQERKLTMLIAEIQKNLKERVRVSIEEYRGHKFIDLRVYFEAENAEWKPTKKGIALIMKASMRL